jgi:hypothetical protein
MTPYSSNKEVYIAHEYGHMEDSKIFGWFYLFVIGIPSLLNNKFKFTKCYYDFWTEKRANKHAGLEVLHTANGRCFLSVKNVLGYGLDK